MVKVGRRSTVEIHQGVSVQLKLCETLELCYNSVHEALLHSHTAFIDKFLGKKIAKVSKTRFFGRRTKHFTLDLISISMFSIAHLIHLSSSCKASYPIYMDSTLRRKENIKSSVFSNS